jgi:catechol 2,3-dioxygenase-like lactoylglutathione lyase family enzyme
MQRAIADYHRDDEHHWVATLACGHTQHLRHTPPFVERPWVMDATRRAAMLGYPLACKVCDDERRTPSPPIDHIVITVDDLDAAARLYADLGFTLTPRAEHPWGTANRLVQFEDETFLELLAIDRPALIGEHRLEAQPAHFSFAAFNRDFLAAGHRGIAMLVLKGEDSARDVARFRAAGLATYAPFDFGRRATLPDGRAVDVAFSLAFASDPGMQRAAFFTCHNKFPENFWKRPFQLHANGATGVRELILVADDPSACGRFITGFAGHAPVTVTGGIVVACGPHALRVMTPGAFSDRFAGALVDLSDGPRFAAIVISTRGPQRGITAARNGAGVVIAWQAA